MTIITINNTRRSRRHTLTDGTRVREYNMGFILSVKKRGFGLSIFYANPMPLDIIIAFYACTRNRKQVRACVDQRSIGRFTIVCAGLRSDIYNAPSSTCEIRARRSDWHLFVSVENSARRRPRFYVIIIIAAVAVSPEFPVK